MTSHGYFILMRASAIYVRWNMGSWILIIAAGSCVEVLRGPNGPRIILLGLKDNFKGKSYKDNFQPCQCYHNEASNYFSALSTQDLEHQAHLEHQACATRLVVTQFAGSLSLNF